MTTIQLTTCDQQLILLNQSTLASGDRNSVRLTVKTDAAWAGYAVTAAFFRDGDRSFVLDVPLDADGTCAIPPQMLAEPCTLCIGIWGRTHDPDIDAEAQYKTSSLIRYRVVEGAPIEEGANLVHTADATATESTVLAGETFYAGDGTTARTGNIRTYEEGTPVLLTPYVESDPTVPAWAKALKKPSYTASEVGAAPAGFGLGTVNEMISDPDSITKSGFYQFISDKLTGSGVNWYLISQHHNEAYADQIAIHVMYGYVLKRTKANYAWGEWEYLNPPMALGVEYRTTERWKGRPVYVKMVDCGEMPSAGTHKNITVTTGLPDTHKLVGMECVFESELYGDSSLKRYCVNYCTETNNSGEIKGLAWGWSSYSGISVTIKAIGDITNYSAVATVKYVK